MKPIILHIETSGAVCSVCLSQQNEILGLKESSDLNSHSQNIALFTDALLKENKINIQELDAVSISMGPGSYTGLRIGVSFAKAICYSAHVPLISVSTLEAMCHGIYSEYNDSAGMLFCPMIDARRMEVYTALYNAEKENVMKEQSVILKEGVFSDFDISRIIFFGSGAEKIKINYPESVVLNFNSSAKHLITPALSGFQRKKFEDVAYFEPNYIKPFYSTAKNSK
jgi:tRNA threonylcarbamoyladenosine biosynthesis protein TsaB